MNINLITLGKKVLIQKLTDEVLKGETQEKIRIIDINTDDLEQKKCINQLISEGYIEKTNNEEVCVISKEFYLKLKNNTI